MSEALLTQEVGSLAKPNWRVAAIAGNELTREHAAEASGWSDRLGLDPIEAEDILCQARHDQSAGHDITPEHKSAVRDLAARQAVRLQERAGLDIVYDGEQDRAEMYQHSAARITGFEPAGLTRVLDNRFYLKYNCDGEPSLERPWHDGEVRRLQGLTERSMKVPITGAYTLADWSFNSHYAGDKRQLTLALAQNVIRPNIEALLAQGIEWIQIDEPAATVVPEEVPLFVESFNESVKGLIGKFSVHLCFSDYSLLFPYIADLEGCSQFSVEFANRDGDQLGIDAAHRPAYEVLKDFRRYAPDSGIGLGVVSIHEDHIESPELVRDRVLRAVDLVGDPAKVYPSPDCGLRTRSWGVAYDKLARTVEGTNLAKQELGVRA